MVYMTANQWPLIAAAIVLMGCGMEPGPSEFDDQEIDEEASNQGQPPGGELGAGSGAGTMAGTWLMVHEASNCVIGQEQVSAAYYLVDIEVDGTGLIEERRLCDLDASAVLGFRPVASSTTLASVQFPHIDYGLVSSHLAGASYGSSTAVGLWGVELDDPIADSVPVDAEDERVIDADGDGNPGVTLELVGSGCERYMGQRQIVKFYGFLEAPNDIRGRSVGTTEIEVYGASASTCELAPSVASNDEHSRFRMVRVDGLGGSVLAGDDRDDIDCTDVARFYDDLWDVREPDNDRCE